MIYHRRINRATASKFSKIVINMQSFLQIIYHSITTEVVSVDIQSLQAMIQDVFLYHSSITPKTWYCKRLRDATIVLQTRVFSFVIKKR